MEKELKEQLQRILANQVAIHAKLDLMQRALIDKTSEFVSDEREVEHLKEKASRFMKHL